jgi:hypothetical protein
MLQKYFLKLCYLTKLLSVIQSVSADNFPKMDLFLTL